MLLANACLGIQFSQIQVFKIILSGEETLTNYVGVAGTGSDVTKTVYGANNEIWRI